MKPLLLALASLIVGIVVGVSLTRREFAYDVLPTSLVDAAQGGSALGRGAKAVVVGSDTHRFGTMYRGATGHHVFHIKNAGDDPLTLAKGKSTCKCTLFNLDQGSVAPGETADIELEWKPVTTDSGFEQSAEVLTGDPTNPVITLNIIGKVIDLVLPESREFVLKDLSTNEPARARLRIFNFKGKELSVVKHEWLQSAGVDRFQVSFEPLSPDEVKEEEGATSGVAVLLETSPGLPLGPLGNTLRLTLSEPGVEPLDIRLAGNVTSDISLLSGAYTVPEKLRVDLGVISRPAGLKKTVFLLSKGPFRDETTLTLGKVEPGEEFRVTLGEPLRDNPRVYRYPLTIEIPPQAAPVAHNGEGNAATIQVLATHPQVKELNLKVRYVVKDD